MSALFSDPGSAAKKQARNAAIAEQLRQNSVTAGTNAIDDTFKQFDDGYFSNLSKGYTNYALPQVDQQYNAAKQQLTYALARSGALDSSSRAAKEAELQTQYDVAKQGVQDQGQTYANSARNSVEGARSDLVSALNATGDGGAAANSAVNRASALSQPAAYSPIGQLFSDFTSGLGTQAQAERATALAGGYGPGNSTYRSNFNTGLFGNVGSVVNRS